MEARSEVRKFVARTWRSDQRTPGLSRKLLWSVILVVERRWKTSWYNAMIAATNPPVYPDRPYYSGPMIRPSAHERVEIQTHREDWP